MCFFDFFFFILPFFFMEPFFIEPFFIGFVPVAGAAPADGSAADGPLGAAGAPEVDVGLGGVGLAVFGTCGEASWAKAAPPTEMASAKARAVRAMVFFIMSIPSRSCR